MHSHDLLVHDHLETDVSAVFPEVKRTHPLLPMEVNLRPIDGGAIFLMLFPFLPLRASQQMRDAHWLANRAPFVNHNIHSTPTLPKSLLLDRCADNINITILYRNLVAYSIFNAFGSFLLDFFCHTPAQSPSKTQTSFS